MGTYVMAEAVSMGSGKGPRADGDSLLITRYQTVEKTLAAIIGSS